MKVLAFAASSSRQSLNKQLVTHAGNVLMQRNPSAEVEILNLNDFEMPIYSADREIDDGIPEQAHAFYNKITEADAVIISFAEHNGSYTAAYKNIYDWTSRISQKVYQDKPMVLLSTSPGPAGAERILAIAVGSAPFFAMDVKASLSVVNFFDNFDVEQGTLKNDQITAQLNHALMLLE